MARRKRGDKVDGWVIIDKPVGVGSTPAVTAVKRLLNAQKCGHAGTLDPLASGILPIGLGEATKTMPFVTDATKEYQFTVRFGEETETDDLEGAVSAAGGEMPSEAHIRAALDHFVGVIEQVPPAYSAIKVAGQRAYDLARKGEAVDLKARRVEIFALTLDTYAGESQTATFTVTCAKGTYVRSLGRDLARHLGTYGHIVMLRRTRVGPFGLDHAISLENWRAIEDRARAFAELLPITTALDDILVLAIGEEETNRIRHGQAIDLPSGGPSGEAPTDPVLLEHEGKPVALAEVRVNALHPLRVFNL